MSTTVKHQLNPRPNRGKFESMLPKGRPKPNKGNDEIMIIPQRRASQNSAASCKRLPCAIRAENSASLHAAKLAFCGWTKMIAFDVAIVRGAGRTVPFQGTDCCRRHGEFVATDTAASGRCGGRIEISTTAAFCSGCHWCSSLRRKGSRSCCFQCCRRRR